MKYLWGIGLGKDPDFNASAGTVTLSDSGSHYNVESENVELIVNISRNIVLYNRNNPDLTATFTGGGTADTVVQLPGGVTGATSDLIHAWVEISDGRSGIDFLSELAVKDRTYAAIKNTDITLEAETLNIDLVSTNSKIDITNLGIGGTASATGEGSVIGQLLVANEQGATSNQTMSSMNLNLDAIALNQGTTASSTGDASVIGILKNNQEALTSLLEVPVQSYFAIGGNIRNSFGVAGINLGVMGKDLHEGDVIVVIRALSDDVLITLGSQDQFDNMGSGTADCMAGQCDGFVGDLLNQYPLPKDDFLEADAKMIQLYDAVHGNVGATGTVAQITLVKAR
jgi:hypothetical protein